MVGSEGMAQGWAAGAGVGDHGDEPTSSCPAWLHGQGMLARITGHLPPHLPFPWLANPPFEPALSLAWKFSLKHIVFVLLHIPSLANFNKWVFYKGAEK